jgi:hypothetical protein
MESLMTLHGEEMIAQLGKGKPASEGSPAKGTKSGR